VPVRPSCGTAVVLVPPPPPPRLALPLSLAHAATSAMALVAKRMFLRRLKLSIFPSPFRVN
jgi:hypothetical protein